MRLYESTRQIKFLGDTKSLLCYATSSLIYATADIDLIILAGDFLLRHIVCNLHCALCATIITIL